MITVKLVDIMNSVDALNRIMEKDIPAPTAYKVARLARKLNEEIESFNKVRDDLFSKYSTDTSGDVPKIPKDKREDFDKEFNDLLQTEVELDVHKINLKDLGSVNVRPMDMFALDKFIDASD